MIAVIILTIITIFFISRSWALSTIECEDAKKMLWHSERYGKL